MDRDKLPYLWKDCWTKAMNRMPFVELEAMFSLSKWQQFPNANGLNELVSRHSAKSEVNFICQSELDLHRDETQANQYYELTIAQQRLVPTRPNSWHDLFNGLVWLQFPKTKKLLNQWHVEDIAEFGLTPRTIRRDNLTHLDECGVVLAVNENDLYMLELLEQHQWHEAFATNRCKWGNQCEAFVFGHANYEMMLDPFIGLTGKWLAIKVDNDFNKLNLLEKRAMLDQKIVTQLSHSSVLKLRRPLLPIPLLGIPDWHEENNNAEFYQNTNYFRPLNNGKKPNSKK